MDASLILFDSDAELVRARALVDQLWNRAPYPLRFAAAAQTRQHRPGIAPVIAGH